MQRPPARAVSATCDAVELFHVGAGGFGVLRVELCNLNLLCEAEFRKHPDAVVVDVELVPCEAVASADRMSMMVVVPAFAAGEQSHPPVVAGVVLGLKAALAPKVCS